MVGFFCGKCRQVYHAWILWDCYVSFRGGNWCIFVEEIHPQLPGICGHGFLVQAVTAKRWLIDCKLDVCMGRTREGTWVSCLICHNFRKVGVYKSNMCTSFLDGVYQVIEFHKENFSSKKTSYIHVLAVLKNATSHIPKNSGWWFQILFNVHPYLGKWSNLTSIFFRWVGSTTNKNSLNQGHLVVTMVLRRWIWRKQKMKDIILTKAAMPGPLGGLKKKKMLHGNWNIYPRGSMGRTVYLPAFSWFVW